MFSYTVAIRTLSYSVRLKSELECIFNQSVKPKKVLVVLPLGSKIPEYRVAYEEYIFKEKGMVSQRLLDYAEVDTDCILMIDDDVYLPSDSVQKLLTTLEIYNVDLIGVDTFKNHELPLSKKVYVAISNVVLPHLNTKFAFKIHSYGSFSYLKNPKKDFYLSQCCAGNVMLWKKKSYNHLYIKDELWLERLRYTYSEDMLQSYKVYKNKMKIGVVFNSGILHLDDKTSSKLYHNSQNKIETRTMAQFAIWWRTCYKPGNSKAFTRIFALISFFLKMLWMFIIFLSLSILKFNFSYISNFIKGIAEGWHFVHSEPFRSLRPYVFN